MSVTFTAEGLLPGTDADGEWEPNPLEVNLANGNAVLVAAALGLQLDADYPGDLSGAIDAQDFLGRVLVALAISPADEGMPAHELLPGDAGRLAWFGDATVIQGARHPGYLQERLEQLRALAEYAVARNVQVWWS